MTKLEKLISELERIASKNKDKFKYKISIAPDNITGGLDYEFSCSETEDNHFFLGGYGSSLEEMIEDANKWIKNACENWGFPFWGNTVWFRDVCMDAEIRFVIGEVNFNDLKRGLWLPMCLMIFGTNNKGKFSYIDYKKLRKS